MSSKKLLRQINAELQIPQICCIIFQKKPQKCAFYVEKPCKIVSYLQLLISTNVYSEAFNNRLGVTILRLPGGLDFSTITDEDELLKNQPNGEMNLNKTIHSDSSMTIDSLKRSDSNHSLGYLPVESPFVSRRYVINDKRSDSPKDLIKNKKKAYADQIMEKLVHFMRFDGNILTY